MRTEAAVPTARHNKSMAATILGSWGLGETFVKGGRALGYAGIEEQTAHAVMDAAHAAGVRWIDLAPGYGGGSALIRYADWAGSTGNRFNAILKVGRPYEMDRPVSRLDHTGLLAEIETATQQIGAPKAILIKDPATAAFADGTVGRSLRWLQQIYPDCRVGVATHEMAVVDWLTRIDVASPIIELEFNLARAHEALPTVEALAHAGWEVWGMQPLAFGFLAGRSDETDFAPGDFRSALGKDVRRILAMIGQSFWLGAGNTEDNSTMAECALAFCFAQDHLSAVVVGPKSRAQWTSVEAAWRLAQNPKFRRFARGYAGRS